MFRGFKRFKGFRCFTLFSVIVYLFRCLKGLSGIYCPFVILSYSAMLNSTEGCQKVRLSSLETPSLASAVHYEI